jgi:hypothetical protein
MKKINLFRCLNFVNGLKEQRGIMWNMMNLLIFIWLNFKLPNLFATIELKYCW